MNILLQKVAALVTATIVSISAIFIPAAPAQAPDLGATIPITPALFTTSLQASISSSDTSMTLVSGTDKAGTALSGYMCFILDEGASNEEFVCGTASSTSITSMIRGVDVIDGDLEVTALKKAHRRGGSAKVTTYPVVGILARILNGTETIPNALSYAAGVTTSTIASSNANLVNVALLNSTAITGAVNASNAVNGIVELSTSAEAAAGTSTGGTGAALVPPASIFNATSSATTLVPVTRSTGKLDPSFIDGTGAYAFSNVSSLSVSTATSTATSTDAFNLLPAGVVQMYAGATSTVPGGWLLADGTSYATSSYPRLFTVIGYTYGGSGSSFLVPNMGGRFVAGASSTLSTTIGATGGSLTATGTVSVNASGGVNTCAPGGSPCTAGAGPGYTFASSVGLSTGNATSTFSPPYIIQSFIIKY